MHIENILYDAAKRPQKQQQTTKLVMTINNNLLDKTKIIGFFIAKLAQFLFGFCPAILLLCQNIVICNIGQMIFVFFEDEL